MTHESPSKNPADSEGGIAGMLRIVFKKMMQGLDGQLPATVLSYDPVTNLARVKPDIMIVGTSGETVPRSEVAEVPVLAIGGGGFVLRFPIKAGDRGWIEASDRDISLYMQAGQEQETQPNTSRMHSFSDGRFIPDTFARAIVAGEDVDAMVLQSYDGASKVAIDAAGVRVTAPTFIVDAVTTFKQPATFEQPATFDGTTDLNGAVTIDAPVIATEGMSINGIDFGDHVHGGVESGDDKTNGPEDPTP